MSQEELKVRISVLENRMDQVEKSTKHIEAKLDTEFSTIKTKLEESRDVMIQLQAESKHQSSTRVAIVEVIKLLVHIIAVVTTIYTIR